MASNLADKIFDWARAFRFGVVGIAASAVYLGLVNGFAVPIGAMSAFHAHLIGLSASIVVSYTGHHAYTYRRKGGHAFYFPRFAAITAALFVLAGAVAYVCDHYLGLPALVISIAITVLYPAGSYLLHTLWTFESGRGTAAS